MSYKREDMVKALHIISLSNLSKFDDNYCIDHDVLYANGITNYNDENFIRFSKAVNYVTENLIESDIMKTCFYIDEKLGFSYDTTYDCLKFIYDVCPKLITVKKLNYLCGTSEGTNNNSVTFVYKNMIEFIKKSIFKDKLNFEELVAKCQEKIKEYINPEIIWNMWITKYDNKTFENIDLEDLLIWDYADLNKWKNTYERWYNASKEKYQADYNPLKKSYDDLKKDYDELKCIYEEQLKLIEYEETQLQKTSEINCREVALQYEHFNETIDKFKGWMFFFIGTTIAFSIYFIYFVFFAK